MSIPSIMTLAQILECRENTMNTIGEVVDVVVEQCRPFGVFVNMGGEHNALIEIFHMHESSDTCATTKNMPEIGRKLKAIIVGKRKNGQYELALRRKDFAIFGRESEWHDWTQIVKGE